MPSLQLVTPQTPLCLRHLPPLARGESGMVGHTSAGGRLLKTLTPPRLLGEAAGLASTVPGLGPVGSEAVDGEGGEEGEEDGDGSDQGGG